MPPTIPKVCIGGISLSGYLVPFLLQGNSVDLHQTIFGQACHLDGCARLGIRTKDLTVTACLFNPCLSPKRGTQRHDSLYNRRDITADVDFIRRFFSMNLYM